MLKQRRRRSLNNKGLAVLEMIPVIIVVGVMLRYTYGFFGVIQAATLQSIASRNYAFETFRHRSSLVYFREARYENKGKYTKGVRVHGVRDEESPNTNTPEWWVARRNISFPVSNPPQAGGDNFRARMNGQSSIRYGRANETVDAAPVWLAISYGICIDHRCGE